MTEPLPSKPAVEMITMYMAKGKCLAPFFGIAYSKKEMRKRFAAFGMHGKYKIVRVAVSEASAEKEP